MLMWDDEFAIVETLNNVAVPNSGTTTLMEPSVVVVQQLRNVTYEVASMILWDMLSPMAIQLSSNPMVQTSSKGPMPAFFARPLTA